ncbi:hypothetical protein E0T50_002758, partial [Enterococcus faecalis]|nr:hypothetical protein [Enterococcus faecalis]
KTGYSLLNINQLKVSEQTILKGTSESELDKNIDQYISTTGFDKIKPVKFVKYPDTSKAGSSEAVIQVEESLTSGGVATYEYTVPFKIDRRNVAPSANGVTQKINIGETLKDRLPENALDVLTNISDDFDKPEDLKATYETLPAADVVGGTEVTVKLEDSEGASTLVKVPVDVQWGSTLVAQSEVSEKTVAAISLLDKGGIPSLVATEGNGFGNVLVLNSRPTIGIYSKNLMQPTLELNYVTVNQTPTALKDTWNSALSKTSLKYGDVISLSVNKRTVSNENLMGSKTAVSKSEVLVKETEGYPVAFYEIT